MKPIVLFRCCDAHTPLARLRARRRWADWVITVWLSSGVSMAEAIAAIVLFGASTFEIALALASTAVCLLTAVPAIVALPVVGEFERELAARGALSVAYVPVERRVSRYVGRMLLAFVLTGVAIAIFR